MRKLFIIRGPAGSGKRDIVKRLGGKARRNWWDTELFWYHIGNGHYTFDVSRMAEAENWCADSCIEAMAKDADRVIFSTDNPSVEMVNFYARLAANHDYEIEVIRTDGPWNPHELKLNTRHHTPFKVLQRQINSYEEYPDERDASQTAVLRM